jgi:hypothetical protein
LETFIKICWESKSLVKRGCKHQAHSMKTWIHFVFLAVTCDVTVHKKIDCCVLSQQF